MSRHSGRGFPPSAPCRRPPRSGWQRRARRAPRSRSGRAPARRTGSPRGRRTGRLPASPRRRRPSSGAGSPAPWTARAGRANRAPAAHRRGRPLRSAAGSAGPPVARAAARWRRLGCRQVAAPPRCRRRSARPSGVEQSPAGDLRQAGHLRRVVRLQAETDDVRHDPRCGAAPARRTHTFCWQLSASSWISIRLRLPGAARQRLGGLAQRRRQRPRPRGFSLLESVAEALRVERLGRPQQLHVAAVAAPMAEARQGPRGSAARPCRAPRRTASRARTSLLAFRPSMVPAHGARAVEDDDHRRRLLRRARPIAGQRQRATHMPKRALGAGFDGRSTWLMPPVRACNRAPAIVLAERVGLARALLASPGLAGSECDS